MREKRDSRFSLAWRRGRGARGAAGSPDGSGAEPGPADTLRFDPDAFESRLAWMFGSPRTGSTWLLRLLTHPWEMTGEDDGLRPPKKGADSPPHIVPINESRLAHHLTPALMPSLVPRESNRPEDFLANTERLGNPSFFFNDAYGDAWRPAVRRMILARFSAQANRVEQQFQAHNPLVVVKEPNGSHGAQLVMSLLPRARLIFLVRDGRDVVDSMLARRLPGGHGSRAGRSPIEGQKHRLAYVDHASRLWVSRMSAVQSAYEAHPPELRYRLSYEGLRQDTFRQLRSLVAWLGMTRSDDQVHAAVSDFDFDAMPDHKKGFGKIRRSAQPGSWRQNLTSAEQRGAEEIMGDKLVELGYESSAAPITRGHEETES